MTWRPEILLPPHDGLVRAEQLLRTVCLLAGSLSFLDDIQSEFKATGLSNAIATHDTGRIYDWLIEKFSYQGISDQVARGYMEKYGSPTWSELLTRTADHHGCLKLRSYWGYADCRYDKGSRTCSEPDHFDRCPVPRLPLRNGRLNQTAFSFFLFVRDIARGNLVGWIDDQLADAELLAANDINAARQEALIGPLRNVYGVADKVLTMAFSTLLLGLRTERPIWFETGAAMVTIDTLVHNFLHRTGILQDCGTTHPFGPACYRSGGCAEILQTIARRIDARVFNPVFPALFPRFIQHAVWRYCAAEGLNVCNGNRIDDRSACRDAYCRLGSKCQRKALKP